MTKRNNTVTVIAPPMPRVIPNLLSEEDRAKLAAMRQEIDAMSAKHTRLFAENAGFAHGWLADELDDVLCQLDSALSSEWRLSA